MSVYYQSSSKSSGNVIFLILIAIGLFASLSYAVSQSRLSSKLDIKDEKTQLAAGVNNQCTANINAALSRLTIVKGCASDQISYELPDGSNLNPKAPADKSCHLFQPAGGGIVPCGMYAAGSLPCLETLNIGESCAGMSGSNRLYTTPSDQGAECWGRCTTLWIISNGSDAANGTANTDKMATAGVNIGMSCRALGEKWFLPSINESLVLYTNRIAIGGFTADNYWTSTERPTDAAWARNFGTGTNILLNKNLNQPYRCVRMD